MPRSDPVCPRCDAPLLPFAEAEAECWLCPQCGGRLSSVTSGAIGASEATADIDCPLCGARMESSDIAGAATAYCCACEHAWLTQEAALALADQPDEGPQRDLLSPLRFAITLPERLGRMTVAAVGGAIKETAEFALPEIVRGGKSYEVVVGRMLRFLIENVGQVEGVYAADEEDAVGEQYLVRKGVGNFVELAGLATLHVSPLWVLALVSDAAYGARTYLRAFAAELAEQGLIESAEGIETVDDLLDALQDVSGALADQVDAPPLSVDALRESARQVREEMDRGRLRQLFSRESMATMWSELQEAARRENRSLFEVSSAVGMHALRAVRFTAAAPVVGLRVSFDLFNDHVLDHYREALGDIRQRGFYATLLDVYGPYARAMSEHLDPERPTWTDALFRRETWRQWGQRLRRKRTEDEPPTM